MIRVLPVLTLALMLIFPHSAVAATAATPPTDDLSTIRTLHSIVLRANQPDPKPSPSIPAPISVSRILYLIAQCESGGNYRAVSAGGTYRGAYQFSQSTWDTTVSRIGLDDWVGVAPDQAPPSVQDRAARALYQDRGVAPWPVCGPRAKEQA